MALEIYTFGHPVLRDKSESVELPDPGLTGLTEKMLKFMVVKGGVGLAAPQIGMSRRICVINFDPEIDVTNSDGPPLNPDTTLPLVMVNPRILEKSGRQTDMEGCLSVPDIWAPVSRAMEIDVVFSDIAGETRSIKARGFLARVIQHELDHLDGVLFVDRISAVRKIGLSGDLKRLRRKTESQMKQREKSFDGRSPPLSGAR